MLAVVENEESWLFELGIGVEYVPVVREMMARTRV